MYKVIRKNNLFCQVLSLWPPLWSACAVSSCARTLGEHHSYNGPASLQFSQADRGHSWGSLRNQARHRKSQGRVQAYRRAHCASGETGEREREKLHINGVCTSTGGKSSWTANTGPKVRQAGGHSCSVRERERRRWKRVRDALRTQRSFWNPQLACRAITQTKGGI